MITCKHILCKSQKTEQVTRTGARKDQIMDTEKIVHMYIYKKIKYIPGEQKKETQNPLLIQQNANVTH